MAGIMDKIKGMIGGAKGKDGAKGGLDVDALKAKAGEVKDKVDDLVDKAGEKVPDKVKQTYEKVSDKVESVIPGKHHEGEGAADAGEPAAAGDDAAPSA